MLVYTEQIRVMETIIMSACGSVIQLKILSAAFSHFLKFEFGMMFFREEAIFATQNSGTDVPDLIATSSDVPLRLRVEVSTNQHVRVRLRLLNGVK